MVSADEVMDFCLRLNTGGNSQVPVSMQARAVARRCVMGGTLMLVVVREAETHRATSSVTAVGTLVRREALGSSAKEQPGWGEVHLPLRPASHLGRATFMPGSGTGHVEGSVSQREGRLD